MTNKSNDKKIDLKYAKENDIFWNASLKEHFDMLDSESTFYDDEDFLKEVMASDDINEVKQALMSIHINSVEKAIINYTNSIMETLEPHSKEMRDKAVALYDKMIRDYYKQLGLDYDKMLDDACDCDDCNCGEHHHHDGCDCEECDCDD